MHTPFCRLLVSLLLLLALSLPASPAAAEPVPTVAVDGQVLDLPAAPLTANGRVLVPMRPIFEALGAEVLWDGTSSTVSAVRGWDVVRLTVGSRQAYVDGRVVTLDSPPVISNGRTLVPVRFVGEALGAAVEWEPSSRVVTVTTPPPVPLAAPSLSSPRRFALQLKLTFVNRGDTAALTVRVPVWTSNSPYQEDGELRISPAPAGMLVDDYGNRTAIIRVEDFRPGHPVTVLVERELLNWAIVSPPSPVSVETDGFTARELYLRPQALIESDHREMTAKARELKGTLTDAGAIARRVFGFVSLHMTYDPSSRYAHKGALSALRTGRGVCEDYAALFTALCRAAGVPARVVSGYWVQAGTSLGSAWNDASALGHAWAEYYAPGAGWIPVEPTVTTVGGPKVVPWDCFGRLGQGGHLATRYALNQGVEYQVSGYGRLDPVLTKWEGIRALR